MNHSRSDFLDLVDSVLILLSPPIVDLLQVRVGRRARGSRKIESLDQIVDDLLSQRSRHVGFEPGIFLARQR